MFVQGRNMAKKIPKKKEMNYYQAMTYFRLEPYGDADKDSVPNFLDCRPFDPDKHFLKLGDIKAGFGKVQSAIKQKFEKPVAEPRKQLSRAPKPTTYKPRGKLYLYIKINGIWSRYGAYEEGSISLTNEIKKLYRQGRIEAHKISSKPNESNRLNRAEKIKPVLKGIGERVEITKKHMREEVPKLAKSYQERIGLGATGEEATRELGRRVREGLAIKPQREVAPIPRGEAPIEETIDMPETEMPIEEVMPSKEYMAPEYEIPAVSAPEYEPHIREEPLIIDTQQRGGRAIIRPPMSVGWWGSIGGGGRPYRPLPYKPTGKIIFKPKHVFNPNPKIPEFKVPMTTFKFVK